MIRYDGRINAKNNLFRCSGQIDLDDLTKFNLKFIDSNLNAKIRVTSLVENYSNNKNIPMKIELITIEGYKYNKRVCMFEYNENVLDRFISFTRVNPYGNIYKIISCINQESKKQLQKLIDLVYERTIKVRQDLFG